MRLHDSLIFSQVDHPYCIIGPAYIQQTGTRATKVMGSVRPDFSVSAVLIFTKVLYATSDTVVAIVDRPYMPAYVFYYRKIRSIKNAKVPAKEVSLP